MRVVIGVLVALVGAVAGAAIGFALVYGLLSGEEADALTWVAAVVFFCTPAMLAGAVAAGLLCRRFLPDVYRYEIGAIVGYGIGAAALVLVAGPLLAIELAAGDDESARDLLEGELCTKSGIRYVSETPQLTVCFTLSADRSKLVELGWRFGDESVCPGSATYSEYEYTLSSPGRIAEPGFAATISGARASGTLEDSDVCTGETFEWSARRAT